MEEDTTQDKIDFTVSVFTSTLRNKRLRVQNALRDREETHDLLQKGLGRDSKRGELITDGVLRLFDTLELVAREFNQKHPDDMCTTQDFGDILLSAIRTLQKV